MPLVSAKCAEIHGRYGWYSICIGQILHSRIKVHLGFRRCEAYRAHIDYIISCCGNKVRSRRFYSFHRGGGLYDLKISADNVTGVHSKRGLRIIIL
jgi:hypothetical protein